MVESIIIAIVFLVLGMVVGGVIAYKYVFKKQIIEFQERTKDLKKDEIRNMLSAMGRKPSEEEVNRIIGMAENMKKKVEKEKKKPKKKK
jgi:uncharacterized protein YneF (UPF0154 family)